MSRIIQTVEIELDKIRHLRFDMNAWYDIEEKTGIDLRSTTVAKLKVGHLRAVVWACLRHEDPDLTLEVVGSLIDLGNLDYVSERLNQMFMLHGGKAEVDEKEAAEGDNRRNPDRTPFGGATG